MLAGQDMSPSMNGSHYDGTRNFGVLDYFIYFFLGFIVIQGVFGIGFGGFTS